MSLLNEFAANATKRQVIAGPVEATAIGNVLIQAIALGHVKSLTALRRIVRDSFALQTFEPRCAEDWQAAYRAIPRTTILCHEISIRELPVG